jgi:hypothetical protein
MEHARAFQKTRQDKLKSNLKTDVTNRSGLELSTTPTNGKDHAQRLFDLRVIKRYGRSIDMVATVSDQQTQSAAYTENFFQ